MTAVIEQDAPEPRVRGLEDRLRERGWSATEVARAPNSWAVIGDVVLIRLPEGCPRPTEVGEALLELQGATTVLARRGIEGQHREPDVDVLAGTGETETVHTENGTEYALDPAAVMFSPGNKAERVRMGEVVAPGESVVDMFAGIGYFALPMARSGAEVTAIERNPTAFDYLVENARRNGVVDRIRPINADCREATTALAAGPAADRVVMGYYDAHEYLDSALSVLAVGGSLHYHEAAPNAELWERPVSRLEAAARRNDRRIEIEDRRRVKTHSEGVSHVVLDGRVS